MQAQTFVFGCLLCLLAAVSAQVTTNIPIASQGRTINFTTPSPTSSSGAVVPSGNTSVSLNSTVLPSSNTTNTNSTARPTNGTAASSSSAPTSLPVASIDSSLGGLGGLPVAPATQGGSGGYGPNDGFIAGAGRTIVNSDKLGNAALVMGLLAVGAWVLL